MRKKTVLCMVMAGVLVLGCGCGKEEKKTASDASVVSSSEANTRDSSGSSPAEMSSEEKQDSSAEKTSGTSENTSEEKTETSENSGEEKKDSSENTGEGQKDSSENAASSREDKLDKDDGKTLDQIFEDCATIGEGVAGVSLKRTQQAYAVAKYAAKNRFTENDLGKLKKAFAERYEKLDSDGKESFTGAFEGEIISLLDEAITTGHFENVRDQFDDVGAAEKMEKLLLKKGLPESWSVIKEAYAGIHK